MTKRHTGAARATGADHRRHGADTIARRRRRVCRETGKVRYGDSHQAAQALEGSRRRGAYELVHFGQSSRQEIRSYRCDHCGGHHLTSEERGQRSRPQDSESLRALVPLPTGGRRRRRIAAVAAIAAASAA